MGGCLYAGISHCITIVNSKSGKVLKMKKERLGSLLFFVNNQHENMKSKLLDMFALNMLSAFPECTGSDVCDIIDR